MGGNFLGSSDNVEVISLQQVIFFLPLSSALCLIVQFRLWFLHKEKEGVILPNEKLHDSLQGPLICLINFLGVICEIY